MRNDPGGGAGAGPISGGGGGLGVESGGARETASAAGACGSSHGAANGRGSPGAARSRAASTSHTPGAGYLCRSAVSTAARSAVLFRSGNSGHATATRRLASGESTCGDSHAIGSIWTCNFIQSGSGAASSGVGPAVGPESGSAEL